MVRELRLRVLDKGSVGSGANLRPTTPSAKQHNLGIFVWIAMNRKRHGSSTEKVLECHDFCAGPIEIQLHRIEPYPPPPKGFDA